MRSIVLTSFVPFTRTFEGEVLNPYLDVKGLLTIGDGDLCDTLASFQALPLVHANGAPATPQEKASAYAILKAAPKGMLASAYTRYTDLRLTTQTVSNLAQARLKLNDRILCQRFPGYEGWCADFQLCLNSMAWGMGANFNFPLFQAWANASRFDMCALECKMSEVGNSGVAPRNVANKLLCENANAIHTLNLDPDVLYYPNMASIPLHEDNT